MKILKNHNYFEYLKDNELNYHHFLSLLQTKTIKKGNFFLKGNEKCNYLGLVVHGVLRSFYINNKGEEINFLFHIENQLFGDYESALINECSKLNIQALKDTTILIIAKEDLFKLYQSNEYWQEFGRKISESIYISSKKRIEEMLYYSPEERYQNLAQNYPQILQNIPQKHIASYI
ncbi:MAG: Crp/Fnr family transcriptional regulator, partial [Flavobacteriia bacterium]|nr:Crp/Fnr family transcriptional regulator [Flavobacteriia bacterium]